MMQRLLPIQSSGQPYHAALFMSGSGTNGSNLLDFNRKHGVDSYQINVIVTDAPQSSQASVIAEKYHIPLVSLDIKEFYHAHNEKVVSVRTAQGLRIRELWTNELRRKIAPYQINFGILAGFVPLTNLTGDFPCLNIHPGDLTVEENNQRLLIGLHAIPVEKAILGGHRYLRSSVIIAQAYNQDSSKMDSGPIIGISGKVDIDLNHHCVAELQHCFEQRKNLKSSERGADLLRKIANMNLHKLKENGDWVVFPQAVKMFAENRFAYAPEAEQLYFDRDDNDVFYPVQTVEYTKDQCRVHY